MNAVSSASCVTGTGAIRAPRRRVNTAAGRPARSAIVSRARATRGDDDESAPSSRHDPVALPSRRAVALAPLAAALITASAKPSLADTECTECSNSNSSLAPGDKPFVLSPCGARFADLREGTGATPQPGQTVQVHYNGWLDDFGDAGRKFDSSLDRGRPLSFAVGTGKVIKGWDEALLSMKVGGKRRVIIPPELGYGSKGIGPIPGGATLYFEMNLMAVK